MRKTTSLILLLSVITLSLQTAPANAQTFVRNGRGEILLRTAEVNLPLSGVTFTESKSLDRKGNLRGRAVDKKGREVSAAKLRADEARLYREKYGKLQPNVYEAIQKRKGGDQIKVGFALNIPNLPGPKDPIFSDLNPSSKEALAITERNNRAVDAAVRKAGAPLIEQLTKMKRLPEGFDRERTVSPVVSAVVTVDDLKELVKRPEVLTVFLEEQKLIEFLNSSAKTMNVPSVWLNGITGSGVRVAVVDKWQVDFTNPNLAGANAGSYDPFGNTSAHATMVAGIIAASQFTNNGLQHQGIAYGASIYSANANFINFYNVHDSMDAAANNTEISNYSWGDDCNASSAFYDSVSWHADFIVRHKRDSVVSAAGNSGTFALCNKSGAAAAGYNTIAVGSYDDRKTGLNLMDDQMDPDSTYGNPNFVYPLDFEKPEVVAPGRDITSTVNLGGTSWFGQDSGTSFSSPMISGTAALLVQAKPFLKYRPETTKAIILAAAVHNIEGAAQLSDMDGAGSVDARVAYETVANNRFYWNAMSPSVFGNQTPSPYFDIDMGPIPAGRRVKVALVWDSNPVNSSTPIYQLDADFDLTVFDPQMNPVGGDGRWSDSKELAQFYTTSISGGNYTIRVYRYSWNPNAWSLAGAAWSIS